MEYRLSQAVAAPKSSVFSLAKKPKYKFKCADLFSGAGGLSVGFHSVGFESVFFNEIDQGFAKTFASNFPSSLPFIGPVQELDAKEIMSQCGLEEGELDCIIGGPPCQGFSIYAPKRSADDQRNHLFRHYIRLVLDGLKPKFILMENVPGLVSLDSGQTLNDVIESFGAAGYKVKHKILNSAHYGVPEERWRLFFLATRLDVEIDFPEPKFFSIRTPNFTGGRDLTFRFAIGNRNGHPNQGTLFPAQLLNPTSTFDAISDLQSISNGGGDEETSYEREPASEFQIAMRRGSKKLFDHQCNSVGPVNVERLQYISPGGSWREIPHDLLPEGMKKARKSDHTRRYGRLHPEEPSGTILTRCDPHWGSFFHYCDDRIISVREAARIQSFPDWFRFCGSKTHKYKQVGNAVPPLLAKAIAQEIKKSLVNLEAGDA